MTHAVSDDHMFQHSLVAVRFAWERGARAAGDGRELNNYLPKEML